MKYNGDKLLHLTKHLLPEDLSLVEEVRLSIENPSVYLRRYKLERDTWRGYHQPTSNLPWFALIDGLRARQLIFEYRNPIIEDQSFSYWQDRWPMKEKRRTWVIKEGRWNGEYTIHETNDFEEYKGLFIEVAGSYLEQIDFVLVELIPSDHSHAMTIIEKDRVKECRKLAYQSGFGRIIIHPLKQDIKNTDVTATFYLFNREDPKPLRSGMNQLRDIIHE